MVVAQESAVEGERSMKEAYYSDNGKRYMLLGEEEMNEESVGYEMRMLCKNHLEMFIPVREHFANGNVAYEYDITGYRNLEEYGARKGLGLKELTYLGGAIDRMRTTVEAYMLDMNQVLLSTKYIFIKDGDIKFTYCLEKKEDFFIQLKGMWEDVLAVLDHSDKRAVMMAYGIYQDLLRGVFEPEKYLLAEKTEKAAEEEAVAEKEVVYTNQEIAKEEVIEEAEEENTQLKDILQVFVYGGSGAAIYGLAAMMIEKINILGLGKNFLIGLCVIGVALAALGRLGLAGRLKIFQRTKMVEHTKEMEYKITPQEVANSQCPTQFLSLEALNSAKEEGLRLLHRESKKVIEVVKFPALLGNMPDCNVLIEGMGVSRVHAVITKQEDGIFIEDMESTNGTWINDEKIVPGRKYSINSGDTVRLATQEYEVRR